MAQSEAAAEVHDDYPVIVTAWKSVGSRLAGLSEQERQLASDWQSVGDLLAYIGGHGDHDGWTFNPVTQVMACKRCGPMYEVGEPVTAVT